MTSTGIRRKVDDLGRVVIPAGIRRSLNIREGDAVEVAVEGDRVILSKPKDHCVLCGALDHLETYRSKRICRDCVGSISALDDRLRSRPAADESSGTLPPWETPERPARQTSQPAPPARQSPSGTAWRVPAAGSEAAGQASESEPQQAPDEPPQHPEDVVPSPEPEERQPERRSTTAW